MQEEPLFRNRLLLRRSVHHGRRRRPVERVGYERGNGAQRERREIEKTGRENLGITDVPRREPGSGSKPRRVDDAKVVLERVPALVELRGFGFRGGFDWGNGVRVSGFGGSGEHLDDLFEGGGICLDEGCRVGVRIGFGSHYRLWVLL